MYGCVETGKNGIFSSTHKIKIISHFHSFLCLCLLLSQSHAIDPLRHALLPFPPATFHEIFSRFRSAEKIFFVLFAQQVAIFPF